MRIVESPCDGVENACYAVLRDAAAEERVALEGAEGVVCDFGMSGGGALSDEVKVDVGAEWCGVEEDEPDVHAQLRLFWAVSDVIWG